jgi:prepilin-type N-terminal cleavage/methylation domain-containing protein
MKIQNSNKGFTLIELLVVISIIGLLSSIVLASLNTTRVRASDAAIKENLRGIIASSEIEYSTLGYLYNTTGNPINSTTCSTLLSGVTTGTILQNKSIQDAIKDIKNKNGGVDVTCNLPADGKTYTISAPLKTPNTIGSVDNSSGNVTISASAASTLVPITSFVARLYGTNQSELSWTYNNSGTSGRSSASNIPPITGSVDYVFEYAIDPNGTFTPFYTHTRTITSAIQTFTGVMPSNTFPSGTTYYFRAKVVAGGQSSAYTTNLMYFTTP